MEWHERSAMRVPSRGRLRDALDGEDPPAINHLPEEVDTPFRERSGRRARGPKWRSRLRRQGVEHTGLYPLGREHAGEHRPLLFAIDGDPAEMAAEGRDVIDQGDSPVRRRRLVGPGGDDTESVAAVRDAIGLMFCCASTPIWGSADRKEAICHIKSIQHIPYSLC